jgi:hypothetical protein
MTTNNPYQLSINLSQLSDNKCIEALVLIHHDIGGIMASLFSFKKKEHRHLYMNSTSFLRLVFSLVFFLLVLLLLSFINVHKLDVCLLVFSRYGCYRLKDKKLRIKSLSLKLYISLSNNIFICTTSLLSTSILDLK